jgi:tRNA threonylcarbamoyladenosine biosynthesis protein TsaB
MSVWLAVDTATDVAGIALRGPDVVLGEWTWSRRLRHSGEVAARIRALLAENGVAPRDLAGVAVAIGPGSFTGLRVGLSLAKSLAWAAHLPLVPVPTLDTLAAAFSTPACAREVPLWAVLRAGRGRIVAACYPADEAGWPDPRRLTTETVGDLAARISGPAWVAGELDAADRSVLAATGVRVIPPAGSLRRPGWLAELGRRRVDAAVGPGADQLAAVSPVYLDAG